MDVFLSLTLVVALAWIAMTGLIRWAPALDLMDYPGGRKQHAHGTPVVGGLAIAISLLPLSAHYAQDPLTVSAWGLGSLLLMLLGWLDDISELHPVRRLLLHVLAGSFLIPPGLVLQHLGNITGLGVLQLGWLAIPLTLFAVAASINAMNMIDGVDGLLGMVTLPALVMISYLAHRAGLPLERLIAAALAVSLLVFLVFNFRFPWVKHARVFMGDAGSTLMGFNLAFLVISLAVKGAMPGVLALYLLCLPLLDTAGVIVRRRLRGVSAATPGRDHLHHILLDAGFSVRATATLMGAVSLLLAAGGVAAWLMGVTEFALFVIFLIMLVAYLLAFRSVQQAAGILRQLIRV